MKETIVEILQVIGTLAAMCLWSLIFWFTLLV